MREGATPVARGATCGERSSRCACVPSCHLHHAAKGVYDDDSPRLCLCICLGLLFLSVDYQLETPPEDLPSLWLQALSSASEQQHRLQTHGNSRNVCVDYPLADTAQVLSLDRLSCCLKQLVLSAHPGQGSPGQGHSCQCLQLTLANFSQLAPYILVCFEVETTVCLLLHPHPAHLHTHRWQ